MSLGTPTSNRFRNRFEAPEGEIADPPQVTPSLTMIRTFETIISRRT